GRELGRLSGERHTSTSKTTNFLLLPPTAQVNPSGANATQRTVRPRAKSSERIGWPVWRPKSVNTRSGLRDANTGAVGWNAKTEGLHTICPTQTDCDETSHNWARSPANRTKVSPSGENWIASTRDGAVCGSNRANSRHSPRSYKMISRRAVWMAAVWPSRVSEKQPN